MKDGTTLHPDDHSFPRGSLDFVFSDGREEFAVGGPRDLFNPETITRPVQGEEGSATDTGSLLATKLAEGSFPSQSAFSWLGLHPEQHTEDGSQRQEPPEPPFASG